MPPNATPPTVIPSSIAVLSRGGVVACEIVIDFVFVATSVLPFFSFAVTVTVPVVFGVNVAVAFAFGCPPDVFNVNVVAELVSSAMLVLLIAHSTVYPLTFPIFAEAVSVAVGVVSLLPLAGNVKVFAPVNVSSFFNIVIVFVTTLSFNVAVTVTVLFCVVSALLITNSAFLLS